MLLGIWSHEVDAYRAPDPFPAPDADIAGNREIPTTVDARAPAGITRYCTPGRQLCVSLHNANGWLLSVAEGDGAPRSVAALPTPDAGTSFAPYGPAFADADGSWLIGVIRGRQTQGDKGWHSVWALLLFRVAPGAADVRLVLDAPLLAMHRINLCANPNGHPAVPPGCGRDYSFSAFLTLDRETRAGPPRLILQSGARLHMGPRAPLPGPGVTEAMMIEDDPVCSYRRVFSLDPATGRYLPDAPLPDCANYFQF